MLFSATCQPQLSCSRTVTSLVKVLCSDPTTHGFVQFDHAGYTVRSTQQAKLDAGKVHQKALVETLQQLRSFMLDKI